MLDALTTAALISLGLALYISGGRTYWCLAVQSDAAMNPKAHAHCELQAGLARGYWLSHAFRWAFILFWPFWLSLGWVSALIQRHYERS